MTVLHPTPYDGRSDPKGAPMARTTARTLALPLLTIAFATVLLGPPLRAESTGDIDADGAFTCDFQIKGDYPIHSVPPVIERDRIYMARRPGMLYKHIPIRPDIATGNIHSGGRYLFETHAQAEGYERWVKERFVLDGTLFLDRDYFLSSDCHAWKTVAAHSFGDIRDSQIVFRTERWSVPKSNQLPLLKQRWPAIRAEAERRGYSAVWLLYRKQDRFVSIVSYAPRTTPVGTDLAGLAALEAAPSMGAALADQGWPKVMDLTTFSLNIWFPNPGPTGDRGDPSIWPNSPFLPEPGPNDGVCVPSRGENHATAPSDCSPDCGDGVWDAGEDNRRCPSDVPHF